MKRRALSWQIGLLLAATLPAMAALPVVAQTPDQAGTANNKKNVDNNTKPQQLPTIVVTAERRSQNLQEVPVAVTALGSAELNRRGINNVADLSGLAPGLMIEQNVASSSVTISMRGTFNNDPSLFIDSPVAIYVDGVYYGKTAGSVFDLIDLDRIEVLRGPQGTLYGRNAYAGAINFITHKPTGEFNGRAQIDIGNYNARTGKFAMDLPAIGKLKASVGGNIIRRDGWFNTAPGSSVSQMNNAHSQSGFVDLLLDATDNLSFNYRYDHHLINEYPQFAQVIGSDIEQYFGIPGINAYTGRQTYGGVDAPVLDRMKMDGQAFTATWKLGDNNTLKYIYGYRLMNYDQNLDLDGTALPFAQALEANRYLETSSELQWLGQSGPLNWVAGLYRFNDTGFTDDPQSYFFGLANIEERYGFATSSRAVYGQVNYDINDQWTLTVGARRTIDHRLGYAFQQGAGVNVPSVEGKTSAGATTPMASLSYKLNPDVMFYARYAEGFKSGGFNGQAATVDAATTPYLPEKKKSFEVGAKTMLFDGKLRLNGDLFHERDTGLQQTVAFANNNGSTGTNIVNVGTSTDQGIELSADALLSQNFSMHVNYAYTHVKFDTFMVLGQNVADNRTPAGAPKNTLNVVANATFARMAVGTLRGEIDYRFVDSFYPGAGWIVPPPGQAPSALSRTPAGGTVNARLSLDGMQWGHGIQGEVAFWVKNLGNTNHIDGKIAFGPSFANLTLGYYNLPRTFGVSLIASW